MVGLFFGFQSLGIFFVGLVGFARLYIFTGWSLSWALRHPALSSVIDEGRGIPGFSYIGN